VNKTNKSKVNGKIKKVEWGSHEVPRTNGFKMGGTTQLKEKDHEHIGGETARSGEKNWAVEKKVEKK